MGEYVYVDYSNFQIEGQRLYDLHFEPIKSGIGTQTGQPINEYFSVNFDHLCSLICEGDKPAFKRTLLVGSEPGPSHWTLAKAQAVGFETIIHPRNVANKEKQVDSSIITELLRDAYKFSEPGDVFKLVAGDGDYTPAVKRLVEDGFQVEVIFWERVSRDLLNACTKFSPLTSKLKWLAVSGEPLVHSNSLS